MIDASTSNTPSRNFKKQFVSISGAVISTYNQDLQSQFRSSIQILELSNTHIKVNRGHDLASKMYAIVWGIV